MKKQRKLTGLLAALAAGLILAGCSNPLTTSPDAHNAGGKTDAAETGSVHIRLAGGESRTLLPDAPQYNSYAIDFSGPEGAPPVSSLTKTPDEMDAGVSVELPEGSWTIAVTGKVELNNIDGIADGEYPAAAGSATVTVTAGGTANAAIALAYSATAGQGVLAYSVTVPAYAVSASLAVLRLTGETVQTLDVKTAPAGTLALDAGYYLVKIAADGKGDDHAVKTSILHIYRALTTTVNITSDFDIIKNTVIDDADAFNLTDAVPAPVEDAAIQSSVSATDWYTAALSWSPAGVLGYYGFGTAYTATVVLTPKEGLTFGAVTSDAFEHDAATASAAAHATDGTVTVTLAFAATASLDHTDANGDISEPGLYIGARTTPKSGVDTLAKAFTCIAASAVENGKYRYVLGADENQEAKTLDAAAFGNKTGVTITLAGDTEERTIQLIGTGQLYTIKGNKNGTLALGNNITLKGVNANTGALISVEEDNTLLMLTGSKITGNVNAANGGASDSARGTAGGGVVLNGGKLDMRGGTITGCTNIYQTTNGNGGGVMMNKGTSGTTVFTMSDGSITGNRARWGGGVNITFGTFTMSGGDITGNTADSHSGGVSVGGNGTFNLEGGTVSGNTAANGGGVYVNGGAFTMSGTAAIGNNTVTGNGGGVWVKDNGAITKTGGTIYGNNEAEGIKNTATNGPAVYIATTTPFVRKNTLDGYLTKAATDTTAIPAPQDDTGVATFTVTADGSSGDAGDSSENLTFTFSSGIDNLTADAITLSGSMVTKGDLTGSGTSWTLAIETSGGGEITAVIDFPGVTINPSAAFEVYYAGPALVTGLAQVTGVSALTNTASITITLNKAVEPDLAIGDIALTADTTGEVTLGTLTKTNGTTYSLALASVAKEGDITLTFTHDDIDDTAGQDGDPAANVKTVRVFKDIDHTAANASAAAPGLYAGAMAVPVLLNPAPANTGADLLTKAYVWIAANARASGKYRIVLGDNANQAAKELNAAAFHNVANVIITLAGDTEERTIQLTGTGSLFTINYANSTLRLDNFITLRGVAANTHALVRVQGGSLVMENGSKITGNTIPSTVTTIGDNVGGGVNLNGTGVTFTMNGGEISYNKSLYTTGYNGNGGGVFMKGGTPTFTMNGGIIKNNEATYGGGVLIAAGTFTMTGGSIETNKGNSWGGGVGVNNASGSFTMNGTAEISNGNNAPKGGGVHVNNGTFNMAGSAVIKGNTVTGNGGGVCIQSANGKIAKTGGTIYGGNEADTALKNTAANGAAVYDEGGTNKRETTVTEDLAKTGTSTFTGDWTD